MLALALAIAQAGSAMAATFYVDNQSASCSNVGLGTEAQPYCTISAAVAAHSGAGITIIVKPGIYREQVSIPASGMSGSPFVIQASGPGVVIDGTDVFTGAGLWTEIGPQSLGMDHGLTAYDTPWLAASVTWAPQQVFVDGRRLTPSTAIPAMLPSDAFTWVEGEGLYVNVGNNPGLHQVLVGRRSYGFTMNAKSWVTIKGFEITRSDIKGINMGTGCADLLISSNRVTLSDGYGIHAIGSTRITIEDNIVSDCALHGIGLTAGSNTCTIRNNEAFWMTDPNDRHVAGIHLYDAPRNTLYGNKTHHNPDTGINFYPGSDSCLSYNNRSWSNGDHGYDHLNVVRTVHVNDVAYGNVMDGFSIEGDSPNTRLHNCIGVDNGLTTDEFDLWVNDLSMVGFVSDYNLFWNSTGQEPFKFVTTKYATLAAYQAASGQDVHSRQADPKFINGLVGNFALGKGSPCIDAGTSSVPNWPPTDVAGQSRVDDFQTANAGSGPVVYGDIGAFEYVPPIDLAPIVVAPGNIRQSPNTTVTFTVTASDPDGQAITSFTMVPLIMPAGATPTFTTNASKTIGTFTWKLPNFTGDWKVKFVATNTLSGSRETNIRARWGASAETPVAEGDAPAGTELTGGSTGEIALGGGVHGELAFSNGFPNPARGPVEFALDSPKAADVRWAVFDLQGRMMWSEERSIPAGHTQLRWDGSTSRGTQAATGIYLVRAMVDGKQFNRRVVRF